MIDSTRRGLLTGLVAFVAAPAVIRTPGLLMPIRPFKNLYEWKMFVTDIDGTKFQMEGSLASIMSEVSLVKTGMRREVIVDFLWPSGRQNTIAYYRNDGGSVIECAERDLMIDSDANMLALPHRMA